MDERSQNLQGNQALLSFQNDERFNPDPNEKSSQILSEWLFNGIEMI
jgi:hypothetical protein